MKVSKETIVRNGIYGSIVGDALGVPYEFTPRSIMERYPCTTMTGNGMHEQPIGTWSDDSSLILATIDGLTKTLKQNKPIDYETIMENFSKYLAYGEYTPHGEVFDVGNTTSNSITNYLLGVPPLYCGGVKEDENGNGSIMRMLPIALYLHYAQECNKMALDEKMAIIHNMSSLTHRHKRSQMTCGIYCLIAEEIIKNVENGRKHSLEKMVSYGLDNAMDFYCDDKKWDNEISHFKWILSKEIHHLHRDEIYSGGYTLDTLESSVWCLLNNDSYESTVLEAVNLGGDTDTTACTVGGLASIHYGFSEIPTYWVDVLQDKGFVDSMVGSFTESL